MLLTVMILFHSKFLHMSPTCEIPHKRQLLALWNLRKWKKSLNLQYSQWENEPVDLAIITDINGLKFGAIWAIMQPIWGTYAWCGFVVFKVALGSFGALNLKMAGCRTYHICKQSKIWYFGNWETFSPSGGQGHFGVHSGL